MVVSVRMRDDIFVSIPVFDLNQDSFTQHTVISAVPGKNTSRKEHVFLIQRESERYHIEITIRGPYIRDLANTIEASSCSAFSSGHGGFENSSSFWDEEVQYANPNVIPFSVVRLFYPSAIASIRHH